MKTLLRKLENYPIAMCGASLAFITLSNSYGVLGLDFLKPIAIIFAAIGLYMMVLKVIFFPRRIVEELKNPVIGSFYPTFNMALFLIAAYMYQYSPEIAKTLWVIGVILHTAIFLIFFGFRLRRFKIEDMVPSWFVVLVGMVVGTVAGKQMGYPIVSQTLFYVGLVLYFIIWPIMIYRMFKREKIKDAFVPSIGVLAAPASLCIVGYFSITNRPNVYILGILFVTSIFNLIYVYTKIPNSIAKGFVPIHAAFTFPLAISILAMLNMANYFDFIGYSVVGTILRGIGVAETVIGSCVILYVVINFIIMLFKAIFIRKEIKIQIED